MFSIKKMTLGLAVLALMLGFTVMPGTASAQVNVGTNLGQYALLNNAFGYNGFGAGLFRSPIVTGSTFGPNFAAYNLMAMNALYNGGLNGAFLGTGNNTISDLFLMQGLNRNNDSSDK